MTVPFFQVPIDLRVPGAYLEINNTRAVRGLPGMPSRLLVVGQMLAAGRATAGVAVQVLTAGAAVPLFGRGSMLAQMFERLKGANRWTETWALPLADDGAAVKATGAVLFSGTATSAGTLALWIGGRRVRVAVAAGDTAAEVATAAASAINAALDLAVTAAVNGVTAEQVDVTARHAAEAGNSIDIRFNYMKDEELPGGLGVAVTALAGGTANPDPATALAGLGDIWFTDVVWPWTDAATLATAHAWAAANWGPLTMRDGRIYAWAIGSHAALTTLGNGHNSQFLSIAGLAGALTPPWEAAAVIGGVAAYHLRLDPALPLQTLPLPGIAPPAFPDRFALEERNLLLFDGIATVRVDDGGQVLIERLITTYQTNAAGVEDPSFLDVEVLATMAYVRYASRVRVLQRWPRMKLADDGSGRRPPKTVTPKMIRNEIIALLREMEEAGLVENVDQYVAELIVERDGSDRNRANAYIPADVVNQFRVFAGNIDLIL